MNKDYLSKGIESKLTNITYGLLFGGIYDDRLLVKIVNSNKKYNMQEFKPYDGGNNLYLVNDIDNKQLLKAIVIDTCKDLSNKK